MKALVIAVALVVGGVGCRHHRPRVGSVAHLSLPAEGGCVNAILRRVRERGIEPLVLDRPAGYLRFTGDRVTISVQCAPDGGATARVFDRRGRPNSSRRAKRELGAFVTLVSAP